MPTIRSINGDTISVIGFSTTTELLFPNLVSVSGLVDIESNPALATITFGSVVVFGDTNLVFKNNALTQATVDHILSKVNANGTNNGTLDLSGITNADPSVAAIPDIEALLARGWTVLTAHEIRVTDNLLVRLTDSGEMRITE